MLLINYVSANWTDWSSFRVRAVEGEMSGWTTNGWVFLCRLFLFMLVGSVNFFSFFLILICLWFEYLAGGGEGSKGEGWRGSQGVKRELLLLWASHPFFSQFSNFFFFCEHLTLFSHNFPLFFILRASHSFFLTFFLSFHSVHISPFWIENSTFELPELYTYLYGPWVNADIEIGHKEWLLRLQTFM